MSALIFADDRPTSCDDDLYQWAMDAEALIRNLHTENTALRVTEDNLRQELQECQDQRRAAFRRIEDLDKELDAMRAQIVQGEPVAWTTGIKWHPIAHYQSEQVQKLTRKAQPEHGFTIPLYTHSAPQQKPLLFSEIWDNDAIMEVNADARLPFEMIERFVRAIEAAHNIGEKK